MALLSARAIVGGLILAAATPTWGQILPQSKRDRQRQLAKSLVPAQIDLRPGQAAPLQEPRTLRLRVWAARDFRTQTLGWQSHFRRLVERVNQRVRRWPGLRFEVVELKEWNRDSTDGMEALLQDLRAQDPGTDVDYVVGLATAMPIFPDNLHQLGTAHVLGKHMLMRSLHDLAEYQAVREHLDLLEEGDRERLLSARKAHKEELCFLHEWAHTLGAIHARHPTLIMNPRYTSEQFMLDDANAQIVEVALRRRGSPVELARELKSVIESTQFDDWDHGDRKQMLELLARMSSAPAAARPPAALGASGGEPPAVRLDKPAPANDKYQQQLDLAHEALASDKFDLVALLARQLQQDFPDRPGAAATGEELAAARAAARGNLRLAAKHLRRAIELDPQDRYAWGAMAEVLRLAGDRAGRARLAADYERVFGKPLP